MEPYHTHQSSLPCVSFPHFLNWKFISQVKFDNVGDIKKKNDGNFTLYKRKEKSFKSASTNWKLTGISLSNM